MTRYWVTANVWLIIAAITLLGRSYERSAPTRYSFFHSGQWFSGGTYALIVFAFIAIAAFFFGLAWRTRRGISDSCR